MAETARYSDLCRVCGEKTSELMAVNIFTNEGNARQLNKKIEVCLPIQIHETDELPKLICDQCVYKLDLFFDFRERSLRTENLLIDLYKQLNSVHSEHLKIDELMMVQQHHLLNENIHDVGDLELNQLEHREMIGEHQMIDINSQLASIELNHELNHTLNSHIMVNTSRYADELMHQQQLAYTTQTYSLNDIALSNDSIPEKDIQNVLSVQSSLDKSNMNNEEILEPSILQQDEYIIKQEDSNSGCKLLIDENPAPLFLNCDDNIENIDETVTQNDIAIPQEPEQDKEAESLVVPMEVCNICKKCFTKESFQAHYKQHFVKCIVCDVVLANREALEAHSRDVHGDTEENIKRNIKNRIRRDFRVSADSESEEEDDNNLRTEEELPEEKKSKGGKKRLPKLCNYCGKTCKNNSKLVEHIRKHTGEKPFQCNSCDKTFRSKIGLTQHMAKHTGQYKYACLTCGKGFQCKSYLMVHQRVHSDVKPYPCTTCGQSFKSKQSLMDHTNRHLGVKPYICDICGSGFITKGLLKAHQKVHTGEDNRKYSCDVCSKMFVSKSYLQTHMKIHTGEKPFPCDVCGKGFLTRVDLRIHSTMHTGEKSYMCETCGKAFARRDALRCHMRSHTGERPYTCDLCGQTFTQFSPMVIHKRLHTGERPYSCELCDKKFITRSTMSAHMKKHNVKQENG